jgi:hypothetical protein
MDRPLSEGLGTHARPQIREESRAPLKTRRSRLRQIAHALQVTLTLRRGEESAVRDEGYVIRRPYKLNVQRLRLILLA